MTRHAKNCTAGAVYTYHERKHDTNASGYGTKAVRLGKDSIKAFDCCSLTLQPCRNTVVTPDGHIYDKESVLEYILQKKKEIRRKLKDFEKQKNKDKQEASELAKAEQESKLQTFLEKSKGVGSKALQVASASASGSDSPKAGTSTGVASVATNPKTMPSFWLPSLTPQAAASRVVKPDEKVRCLMSGEVLRLKDLMDVHFTPIKDGDTKTSLIVKEARYVCAVTGDVLGNSVPCAFLKTSGNVVTMECVEKLIKKDMIDPTCGKKLTEKDIIQLQRGSTGFSGAGVQLNAEKAGPALQG